MKHTTKKGVVLADIIPPDAYYALTIRSPFRRGTILSIDYPHIPRDYRFITYDDIKGKTTICVGNTEIPILANRKIDYEGQPVAILVGPDSNRLAEIARQVKFTLETTKPYDEYEFFSYKQLLYKEKRETGMLDVMLPKNASILEYNFETSSDYTFHTEPFCAYCVFDYDKMNIYTASQWPALIHKSVSAMLDIKPDSLVVKNTYTGPLMSAKIWFPALISCHAALAAIFSKHAVALVYSREEDVKYGPSHSPETSVSVRIGMDEQGNLNAMDLSMVADFGWQAPCAAAVVRQFLSSIQGTYAFEHSRIEGYAVQTNRRPHDSHTANGTAEALFALERTIDFCANKARIDPLAFRKKNLAPQKSKKGKSPNSLFEEITDKIVLLSDFNRKYASCRLVKSRKTSGLQSPVQHGIGFAFGGQCQTGFIQRLDTFSHSITVTLEKNLDISVTMPIVPDNPEVLDIWQKTVEEIIGTTKGSIRFQEKDTSNGKPENMVYSSNNLTLVFNELLRKACQDIQKKRFRDALPISVKKIYKPDKNIEQESGAEKSWAAVVVELECSGLSLEPRISGVWMVVYAGQILNKKKARSAVLLDVETALAHTFSDSLLCSSATPAQRIKNERAYEYPIVVDFIESKDPPKSMGELAFGLIPAAAMNALQQIIDNPIRANSMTKIQHSFFEENMQRIFDIDRENSNDGDSA